MNKQQSLVNVGNAKAIAVSIAIRQLMNEDRDSKIAAMAEANRILNGVGLPTYTDLASAAQNVGGTGMSFDALKRASAISCIQRILAKIPGLA